MVSILLPNLTLTSGQRPRPPRGTAGTDILQASRSGEHWTGTNKYKTYVLSSRTKEVDRH